VVFAIASFEGIARQILVERILGGDRVRDSGWV